jgi:hypothetical protein
MQTKNCVSLLARCVESRSKLGLISSLDICATMYLFRYNDS